MCTCTVSPTYFVSFLLPRCWKPTTCPRPPPCFPSSTLHTHGVISPFTPPPFIPLSPRCLTKKAALTVSSPLVDYGPGVILAESASRTFTISNGGALDVEYAISLEDPVRL